MAEAAKANTVIKGTVLVSESARLLCAIGTSKDKSYISSKHVSEVQRSKSCCSSGLQSSGNENKHSLFLTSTSKYLCTWSAQAQRERFSLIRALCCGSTEGIRENVSS